MTKSSYLLFDSRYKPTPAPPPPPPPPPSRPLFPGSDARPAPLKPSYLPDTRVPPPGHQMGPRMLQNRVPRSAPLHVGPHLGMGVPLPSLMTVPPPRIVQSSAPYPASASFLPLPHIPPGFPAPTFSNPAPHFNPSFVAPTSGAGTDGSDQTSVMMRNRAVSSAAIARAVEVCYSLGDKNNGEPSPLGSNTGLG